MELTESEEKSIIALSEKHPEVGKLWSKLKEYEEDPAHIYHQSIKKIVKKFAADADAVIEMDTNLFTSKNKDDKTFDRLMMLVTGGDKGFKALRIGKEDIAPEEAEKLREKDKEKPVDTVPIKIPGS